MSELECFVIFLQPVLAGDSNSCVEGLVIKHQASGGVMWSNETTLARFHSFQWRKEVHTVIVMSRNSLGISTRNRNITLLHQAKRELTCCSCNITHSNFYAFLVFLIDEQSFVCLGTKCVYVPAC